MKIQTFHEKIKHAFEWKKTEEHNVLKYKSKDKKWRDPEIMMKYTRKHSDPVFINNIDMIKIYTLDGLVSFRNYKDDSEVEIFLKDIRNIDI